MGASQSTIPSRYLRIWENLSAIESNKSRMEMLETLLTGPEYVQLAKQTGVYSSVLQWMASMKRGQIIDWPFRVVNMNRESAISKVPPQKRAMDILHESYAILDIDDSRALTHEILKTAYKRKAMTTHPDKGGTPEEFDKVTRAFLYIQEVLTKLIPITAQDGSDPRFTQPVTKEHAIKTHGAKQLEDRPPIALNPKKLDMNVFNKLFEENRLPDPQKDDGYGDWLKDNNLNTDLQGMPESKQQALRSKFNANVFHKTFEDETIKKKSTDSAVSKYRPPSELILNPDFGAELGADRPEQYTKAPAAYGIGYTDLKHAYGSGSTFSQEVQDVSLDGRPMNLEQAKREYGSAPRTLSTKEAAALQAMERAKEQAEETRRRRMAAQDVDAETFHDMMQKRMNIKK